MSEDREAKRGDLRGDLHLFERLFVIGCENNSDCDIGISLSLKTRKGGAGEGGKTKCFTVISPPNHLTSNEIATKKPTRQQRITLK